MLDAAEPGRRWPARADIADVVARGLRCRLKLPRGPGLVIVTAVAARCSRPWLARPPRPG